MTWWRPVRISRAEAAAEGGMVDPLSDGAFPRNALGSAATFECGGGFVDQFFDNRRDRLLAVDHADRLARHDRAAFNVAVNHGALQRARPVMLDLQLRLGHL